MKVRIFMASAKYDWERDLLRRWHDGIKLVDPAIDLDFSYEENPEKKVDVGIIYGGVRPAGKGVHDIRRNIVNGCKNVIINETPLLGRTISKSFNWHRVGVNGHLYGEGNFNAKGQDNQRLQRYQTEWNLKRKSWRSNGDHIILALQLPGDSSLRKQDLSEWAINVISNLLEKTNKEIRIRTHPAFNEDDHHQIINLYKHVGKLGSGRVKFSYGNLVPWDTDLQNCHCVIAYSSGLSIDAIDNGIPVIAVDQANFAYDISSHYAEDVNSLKMIGESEKSMWYNELSYCQWSTSEIGQGIVWKHLLPIIHNKLAEE